MNEYDLSDAVTETVAGAPGLYLCCNPVCGKADLRGLGDGSPPLGSRGETPVEVWGTKSPEVEEFLLNLITIFTFPGIKRSFNCDFVINEYNNFD